MVMRIVDLILNPTIATYINPATSRDRETDDKNIIDVVVKVMRERCSWMRAHSLNPELSALHRRSRSLSQRPSTLRPKKKRC